MKRAMARKPKPNRRSAPKSIAAEGEALAADALGTAADIMLAHPLALQLRNLQSPGRDRRGQEHHRRRPGPTRRRPGPHRKSSHAVKHIVANGIGAEDERQPGEGTANMKDLGQGTAVADPAATAARTR
jgi:hypothetical protein